MRGFCSKNEKPDKSTAGINIKQAGFSDMQFIHRKLQNPQGKGRSSDLLRLFSTPSRPFGDGQWHSVETFKELTAAGTVAEFHDIPYYPFPEPLHCKSRQINWWNANFNESFFEISALTSRTYYFTAPKKLIERLLRSALFPERKRGVFYKFRDASSLCTSPVSSPQADARKYLF